MKHITPMEIKRMTCKVDKLSERELVRYLRYRFKGIEIRNKDNYLTINEVSSEWVKLDYIGRSLYDYILKCNRKVFLLLEKDSERKQYSRLYDSARQIFVKRWPNAYRVLID